MRALLASAFVVVVLAGSHAEASGVQVHLDACTDKVNCSSGCRRMTVPSDTCYQLHKDGLIYGDTWDCGQVTQGPCFELRGYTPGTFCGGAPVSNRVNFCDECKGADPHDYVNMQKRTCWWGGSSGRELSRVSYSACASENATLGCTQCNATPAAVYPWNECVASGYEGLDWRLEAAHENCPLMKHVNFRDRKCTDMWWGDRIVLDRCNNGWKFSCPPYSARKPQP